MIAARWILLAVLIAPLCASFPAWGEEIARKQGEAEVTADRLQVDHGRRTAIFEGHVNAKLDHLTIRCHTLSLTYDEGGEVRSLHAKGGVTLVRDDLRATAQVATLDAKGRRLILSGNPEVTKGPHRLTGEVIEVDLRSGKLVVNDARGTFRLKRGTP